MHSPQNQQKSKTTILSELGQSAPLVTEGLDKGAFTEEDLFKAVNLVCARVVFLNENVSVDCFVYEYSSMRGLALIIWSSQI